MFTQSRSEIEYQQNWWVVAIPVAMLSLIVAGCVFALETLPVIGRHDPVVHNIMLISMPAIAGILTMIILIKILTPDKVIISKTGLSYISSSTVRSYPWSFVGTPVLIRGGRGSSSYRIDIAGGDKPIWVAIAGFGISADEFEHVIASARTGVIVDVVSLKEKEYQKNYLLNLRFNVEFAILVSVMMGVIIFCR